MDMNTYNNKEIFHYINLFNKIDKNWGYNFEALLEKLLNNNDLDAVRFVTNNYGVLADLFKNQRKHENTNFIELFNSIEPEWRHNIKKLVERLVMDNDYESLKFLLKNYSSPELNLNLFDLRGLIGEISYLAGYYNNIEIFKNGIPLIYKNYAKGASESNKMSFSKICELLEELSETEELEKLKEI